MINGKKVVGVLLQHLTFIDLMLAPKLGRLFYDLILSLISNKDDDGTVDWTFVDIFKSAT